MNGGTFQALWDKIIYEAVVEGRSLDIQLTGSPEQLSTLRECISLSRQISKTLSESSDRDASDLLLRYRSATGRWEGLTGLRWPLR